MNWAIEAGPSAAMGATDWMLVLTRTGFLIAFLIACGSFATRAFRTYERSL
jgi:hypothetical protein